MANSTDTKFFTNNDENTLINKFEGIFSNNSNIHYFDALVGYFRASGYFRIRPFLDKVPKIRILVGINVDRLIANAQNLGLEFFKNNENTKEDVITKIKKDIAEAKYDRDTEIGIIQFIDDIVSKKIEVKAHPDKNIHAKIYILRPKPFNQHTPASVITGSSNLTDAGLGAGNTYNYEFNVQLNDYSDVRFATEEFEKLWNEAVEILPADIQNIKKETFLNDEITPFEIYIKLLIEYFEKSIEYDFDSMGDMPQNFKKLSYQVDAVNEGYNMLIQHNGFVLADVVGLGKTVVAAMVAKKFIIQNGRDYSKVLVVYPPAVEKNWKNTFKEFKIDKYTKFITNGSLEKVLSGNIDYWNKEEYDLIIVDEAHKFRNHKTDAFQKLQLICKSPRKINGLIGGQQKKIVLVTATPLNNKPDDIFYQIQMFQDTRQSTLPIGNLTSFFSPLMEEYKKLKRFEELDIEKLREIYGKIRKNVIEPITIRRTRTDLLNNPDYREDIEKQGVKFPTVTSPQKVEYLLDETLNQLFYKTISYLTEEDKLTYSRYQAIAGLKEEIQEQYYEKAEMVSKSLAFIMKTQLIKRLESSFFAFKKSLLRFQIATDRMIDMFDKDRIFIAPNLDVNKLIDKDWSDDEIEIMIDLISEENPKNKTFCKSDFKPEYIKELKKDSKLIKELVLEWEKINYDPKLEVFLEQIKKQFLNKETNVEGKLVIFSESNDSVQYLAKALQDIGRKDVLSVSGKNRKTLYETIVKNFDANIESIKQSSEYNIIITTEVLAEGVNLHRSNVVIHYDTPWNSTKLMQRIGRVNRIGTIADTIYNYVFYPSVQGNKQIKLNKTALMKIQAFHTAFGEDNQVFSTDEILDEVKLFSGNFKEEEDKRLKYLFFLRKFRKDNTERFEKIKKMPLKSRTGRNSDNIQRPDLKGGTATFMKLEKKFEFFWIDANDIANEITPVEAFEIFEAKQSEQVAPLIEKHHQHVMMAMHRFEQTEQIAVQSQSDPDALGGVAKRAKKFLSDILRHAHSDNEKNDIMKIIELIDIGKFTNLPNEVDKLQKKKQKLKLNEQLIEIKLIAHKYNVSVADTKKIKKHFIQKSILILSESFE